MPVRRSTPYTFSLSGMEQQKIRWRRIILYCEQSSIGERGRGDILTEFNARQVATVIPVYRRTLTIAEERRLRRTLENTAGDACFFVGPKSLRNLFTNELLRQFPFFGFSDRHFESVRTYNHWILQPELYREFSNFSFVAICQLDAIIVRPLVLRPNVNFDYLGAPWVPAIYATWHPFARELKLGGPRIHPTLRMLRVGNGGLSLRRVSVFRQLPRLPSLKELPNEDLLLSYFHRRLGIRLASPELASQWFMETGARAWTAAVPIPFVNGFHALDKWNPALEEAILGTFD